MPSNYINLFWWNPCAVYSYMLYVRYDYRQCAMWPLHSLCHSWVFFFFMLLYLSTCSASLSFSSINTWVSLQTDLKMLDAYTNKCTEKPMTPVSAETHSVSLDSRKARSSGESTGSLSIEKETYSMIMLHLCKNVIILYCMTIIRTSDQNCCMLVVYLRPCGSTFTRLTRFASLTLEEEWADIVVSICQAFPILMG